MQLKRDFPLCQARQESLTICISLTHHSHLDASFTNSVLINSYGINTEVAWKDASSRKSRSFRPADNDPSLQMISKRRAAGFSDPPSGKCYPRCRILRHRMYTFRDLRQKIDRFNYPLSFPPIVINLNDLSSGNGLQRLVSLLCRIVYLDMIQKRSERRVMPEQR